MWRGRIRVLQGNSPAFICPRQLLRAPIWVPARSGMKCNRVVQKAAKLVMFQMLLGLLLLGAMGQGWAQQPAVYTEQQAVERSVARAPLLHALAAKVRAAAVQPREDGRPQDPAVTEL